ncbi:MAG TPA: class I SAM-dependent methyltransferase, partial [Thermoanaerobaculia bacterium]|nr:class I SAM-dependent methyltransferase [Thermoanaerobaculia bacterium]
MTETAYREERAAHWDEVARATDRWRGMGGAYHRRLERVYRFLVPPGQRVLELGCGRGDLLAALKPSVGVGVDFSDEMVRRAAELHPDLSFLHADEHDLGVLAGETFDAIILSDLLNDLWDVQRLFEQLRPLTTPRTRIILNTYSRLWELPLALTQALKLARPALYQNWLTVHDVTNLLRLSGFQPIRNC